MASPQRTWAVTSEDIKQGVFEFLLLLLDRHTNNNSSYFIDNMLQLGIDVQLSLTAAMWFAGPKLSTERQRSLDDLAATSRVGTNAHDLFAFMYFVSESAPNVLYTPTRLGRLQPYYQAIRDDSLVSYYLYIVERLFAKLHDKSTILDCMRSFTGSEVMGIAPDLAKLTIEALVRCVNGNASALLDAILDYLLGDYRYFVARQKSKEPTKYRYNKTRGDSQRPDDTDGGFRYFYRQWVLYEFCHTLVDRQGLSAYDLLAKRQWYKSREQLGYRISLEMHQEANLALGYWYRKRAWGEEKQAYVELIKKLANSLDAEEREIAFFLIRHTQSTEGRKGIRVAQVFHPILSTLFMDDKLHWIRGHYYEDFKVNLGV